MHYPCIWPLVSGNWIFSHIYLRRTDIRSVIFTTIPTIPTILPPGIHCVNEYNCGRYSNQKIIFWEYFNIIIIRLNNSNILELHWQILLFNIREKILEGLGPHPVAPRVDSWLYAQKLLWAGLEILENL